MNRLIGGGGGGGGQRDMSLPPPHTPPPPPPAPPPPPPPANGYLPIISIVFYVFENGCAPWQIVMTALFIFFFACQLILPRREDVF